MMMCKLNKGFSLIELMIVVAIIGILAAIAYPSYQQNVIDSRRARAAGCLSELRQLTERYYSSNNFTYIGAAAVVTPAAGAATCVGELSPAFYGFSFIVPPTTVLYQIQAVPAGAQLNDNRACGTLTLNQAGTKGASGSGTAAECWRQ